MNLRKKQFSLGQLTIPLIALAAIVIFNLFRDISFFRIGIATNNYGNTILEGQIISIIANASKLAIIAMGMTLVTAACGGQDISVGAIGAIAGSVFLKVILNIQPLSIWTILLGILAAVAVAMVVGLFNGTLVSVFKIQPMIATLILFTCGRSFAYAINGSASPTVNNELVNAVGIVIPGIPIPTPIFFVLLVGLAFVLVFKFTSFDLYAKSVGINQQAARLNGINTTWIKLLTFIILGACCAIAGVMDVCEVGGLNHEKAMEGIEMDAILAVAIGGNSLGGGKYSLTGSIIGAYVIQALTVTLYAMNVPSVAIKAYKAVVIIILVVIGSPVFKAWFASLRAHFASKKEVA